MIKQGHGARKETTSNLKIKSPTHIHTSLPDASFSGHSGDDSRQFSKTNKHLIYKQLLWYTVIYNKS